MNSSLQPTTNAPTNSGKSTEGVPSDSKTSKKASSFFGRKVSKKDTGSKEKDPSSNSTPFQTTPPITEEKFMKELREKLDQQQQGELPLTSPRRRASSTTSKDKEIVPSKEKDIIIQPETSEKRKSVNFPTTPRSSVHFSITPPSITPPGLTREKSFGMQSPPKYSSDSKTRSEVPKRPLHEIATQLSSLVQLVQLASEQADSENELYYETLDSQDRNPSSMQVRAYQLAFDHLGGKEFTDQLSETVKELFSAFQEGATRPRSLTFRNLMSMTDSLLSMTPEKALPFKEAFKRDHHHVKNKEILDIGLEAYGYLTLNAKEDITSASNAVKAAQFGSHPSVYHYMHDLSKLADFLRGVTRETLESLKKDKSKYAQFALLFIGQIEQAKDIRKLRGELQKDLIVQRCHELANMVLIHLKEMKASYRDTYNNKNNSSLAHLVYNIEACMLVKPITTFKADLRRSLYGNFLLLSSDRCTAPTTDFSNNPEDNMPVAVFHQYLVGMLKFWMENLNLNLGSPQAIEIFKKLKFDIDKNESLLEMGDSKMDILDLFDKLFDELDGDVSNAVLKEVARNSGGAQTPETLMQIKKEEVKRLLASSDGEHLKLVPLCRAFNQAILLEVHARTFMLHRNWINLSSAKIVREFNDKKDCETKQIHIAFAGSKAIISVRRLGHLDGHESCLLLSQVTLTADIDNFSEWTIDPRLIIDMTNASESSGLEFKQKYQELLFTLENMGIPYEEGKVNL